MLLRGGCDRVLWSDKAEMMDAENEASSVFWIRMSDDGIEGCNII